jgi:hypothetical protein
MLSHPGGRNPVIFDPFPNRLQRAAFHGSAVTYRQDVVPAAIECQASVAHRCQRWGQESRRAGVEVHCRPVE